MSPSRGRVRLHPGPGQLVRKRRQRRLPPIRHNYALSLWQVWHPRDGEQAPKIILTPSYSASTAT